MSTLIRILRWKMYLPNNNNMYKFRSHECCRSCTDVVSLKTSLFRNSLLWTFFWFRLVIIPSCNSRKFWWSSEADAKVQLMGHVKSDNYRHNIWAHHCTVFIHSWVNRSRHPWISERKSFRKGICVGGFGLLHFVLGKKMCSCCLLDLKWRWSWLSPGGLGTYH